MTPAKQEVQLGVRVPDRLLAKLRAIADRDENGISATVRRLLAGTVAREQEHHQGGAQ